METKRTLLVTGVSGYVGGRLAAALAARGETLRCMARTPEYLGGRVPDGAELVKGDVLDPASLAAAFTGVDTVYYMVHSMGDDRDFESLDRLAAANAARAARNAGVRRIVYLGGLGGADAALSAHLRSRQEVGRVLASTGVEVVELRASIVIGSGSLSFEMIRALVERLPVMITPRWVSVTAQPIAITDLLAYLVEAPDVPARGHTVYEIGSPDRTSYGDLMREYARQRGLRRVMIPVPVLTPRLSSLWLGLVTPLYARIGRKLAESLRHPTVVTDEKALGAFSVRPRPVREAISEALRNEDEEFARTRWSDAVSSSGAMRGIGGARVGRRLVDARSKHVQATAAEAFAPIRRIGGTTGWYYANILWRLRGFMDLLVGGIGMRRGRPRPDTLSVGDTLDWWRVEAYEEGRLLRLAAEFRLPGRAWLEFRVEPDGAASVIHQTAVFDPAGLSGLLYWYAVYPLHALVFRGMLAGIAARVTPLPQTD
ncbi:MAG: SDR family oxidoreductase [Ignavibacteriae bacterium]|nr:SDR family oxidoreductase [Ignavibacteriota bacterium]